MEMEMEIEMEIYTRQRIDSDGLACFPPQEGERRKKVHIQMERLKFSYAGLHCTCTAGHTTSGSHWTHQYCLLAGLPSLRWRTRSLLGRIAGSAWSLACVVRWGLRVRSAFRLPRYKTSKPSVVEFAMYWESVRAPAAH